MKTMGTTLEVPLLAGPMEDDIMESKAGVAVPMPLPLERDVNRPAITSSNKKTHGGGGGGGGGRGGGWRCL